MYRQLAHLTRFQLLKPKTGYSRVLLDRHIMQREVMITLVIPEAIPSRNPLIYAQTIKERTRVSKDFFHSPDYPHPLSFYVFSPFFLMIISER
jgi:hypothetical protein